MGRKVLEVRFDVTGWPDWEVSALWGEAVVQGEESDEYTLHATEADAVDAEKELQPVGHRECLDVEAEVLEYDTDAPDDAADDLPPAVARARLAALHQDWLAAKDASKGGASVAPMAGASRSDWTEVALADRTADAYMADTYGRDEWVTICGFLLEQGRSLDRYATWTVEEAEAILRSKHMRWADDSEGAGSGEPTDAAAFMRYYRRYDERWWGREVVELLSEGIRYEGAHDDCPVEEPHLHDLPDEALFAIMNEESSEQPDRSGEAQALLVERGYESLKGEDDDPLDGWERELVTEFSAKLPSATVEVISTGGGCEALSISFPGMPGRYEATDGQSSLPEPMAGWGYLGFYDDADDDWKTIGQWADDAPASVEMVAATVLAHHAMLPKVEHQFSEAQADTVARLVREQLSPEHLRSNEVDGELIHLEVRPRDGRVVEVLVSASYDDEDADEGEVVRVFSVRVERDGSDDGWREDL